MGELAKLIKDMEATIRWNSEDQAHPPKRLARMAAKEKKVRQALAKQELGGLRQPSSQGSDAK